MTTRRLQSSGDLERRSRGAFNGAICSSVANRKRALRVQEPLKNRIQLVLTCGLPSTVILAARIPF